MTPKTCWARPFVKYVETNFPQRARERFYGLAEAKPDLVGIAIFDHLDKELQRSQSLIELMWRRREIEDYFCQEDMLLAYARHDQEDDLFGRAEAAKREQAMRESMPMSHGLCRLLAGPSPWSAEIKASDDKGRPFWEASHWRWREKRN